ncbi:MAG: hypothetical protein ACXVPU_14390 [Bacteroidia bacterium]
MKNLFALILAFASAFIFSNTVKAQYVNYGSPSKEIQNIAKGDIYVVLTGNKLFDNAFKSAVEKNWKLSKSVKTVKSGSIEDDLKNENNYFIAIVDFHYGTGNTMDLLDSKAVTPQADIAKMQDKNLVVFTGKYSKVMKLNSKTVVATVPFIINNSEDYVPEIEYMVKAVNDGIDLVMKNNLQGKETEQGVYAASRKNVSVLKNKTLVLPNGSFTGSGDLKRYKYKNEYKSSAEINKLLTDGDKNYCVLCYCINNVGNCKSIYVYDLETKSIIYASYTPSAKEPAFEDMVLLNNAVEGK